MTITIMFMPFVNCIFFTATFPYTSSSSICIISGGDLCKKTQKFMFAHCSVVDTFKCDETKIHRNKQTADTS
jgi:hypothetical protein